MTETSLGRAWSGLGRLSPAPSCGPRPLAYLHALLRRAAWSLSRGSTCFHHPPLPLPLSLSVGASFDPGDHAFVSYGPVSNDDLLQYYGFVERDNPSDAYVLEDMGKWLREVCFLSMQLQSTKRLRYLGFCFSAGVCEGRQWHWLPAEWSECDYPFLEVVMPAIIPPYETRKKNCYIPFVAPAARYSILETTVSLSCKRHTSSDT